ncbi:MAG TPA: hypothetical protein VMT23_02845 [Candidatus Binatia bacterium]|nr:hypothetical protein [Candidatus Binatia bacterium]
MSKLIGRLLVVAIIILLIVAACEVRSGKAATNPTPVPVSASFVGYPSCVVPGMNAKFPLVVTNAGSRTLTVTVHLSFVTHAADGDPYGTVIANGTDHLLGSFGNEYWQLRLAPGQSVTKLLVTLVPWPPDAKRGPARYGLTEFIDVSGYPSLQTPVSATPSYCD